MQLKTVHTYQTVRFNKRDETHFDAGKDSMRDIKLTYDKKNAVVHIEMPGCESVLVFPTNIAYAVLAEPTEQSKD